MRVSRSMSRPKAYRMALCHPDRPHYAHSQCRLCWQRERYPREHPHAKRQKQMGLTGLGEAPPTRLPGLEHRALTSLPAQCLKCGNRVLAVDGRWVHCPLCGWGAFWVAA